MARYLLMDRREQPANTNNKFLVRLDAIDALYEEAGSGTAWILVGGAAHKINMQYSDLAALIAKESGVYQTF